MVFAAKGVKRFFFQFLKVKERVMRAFRYTDQLIEFDLYGVGVAILGILNQEHHEERNDRRPCINDELPCVAEAEERTGDDPDCDYSYS